MENEGQIGCTPDKCDSCTGCGGSIEKITLRVEWKHNGTSDTIVNEMKDSIFALAGELAVSGVELVFIDNTYSPDIIPGSSSFQINGIPLNDLTPLPQNGDVTKEILRKGIFQALLQNI